ncbi:MAG: hypothetical protein WCV91_00225 [Candidatus Margulisiibacteriota bacterium]
MKNLIALLLSAAFLISAASAEVLITANPLKQGKWGILGAYLSDSNLAGGATATSPGLYVGYGLTNNLDLFFTAGQSTFGNIGIVPSKTTGYGLSLKYGLFEESASMPVSVALGVGSKLLTNDLNNGAVLTGGNQVLAGVIVSKMMIPFVPYTGLTYRGTTFNGASTQVQTDLTIGTAIAWSMQGAVYLEYTLQSITPNGAANYTANQIGLGVGYKLN